MTKRSTLSQLASGTRAGEAAIVARFRAFGATSPAAAAAIVPADTEEGRHFDLLRRHGAIRGAQGGFYLDEAALEHVQSGRRTGLFAAAGIGVAAVVAGWLAKRR